MVSNWRSEFSDSIDVCVVCGRYFWAGEEDQVCNFCNDNMFNDSKLVRFVMWVLAAKPKFITRLINYIRLWLLRI